MKNKELALKLLIVLLLCFSVSCERDEACDASTKKVNFPLKIKLVSPEGANLFNDDSFNPSLLKLTDTSNNDFAITFSQEASGEDTLIAFQAVNLGSVNFNYNNTDVNYVAFLDIITAIDNCEIKVKSYNVFSKTGDLICNCTIGNPLVISLDI